MQQIVQCVIHTTLQLCSAKGVVKWLHFCICCTSCLSMWLSSRALSLVCVVQIVWPNGRKIEKSACGIETDTHRDGRQTQVSLNCMMQCKPATALCSNSNIKSLRTAASLLLLLGQIVCCSWVVEGVGAVCRGTQEASWSKTCLRSWELISIRSEFKICPKSSESRYNESHK